MNPIKQALVKAVGKRSRPILNLTSVEVGAMSKAFYKKYGKEALSMITEVVSQSGVEWGKIMQQTLPGKSMKIASEQQKMMGAMMDWRMEILEL